MEVLDSQKEMFTVINSKEVELQELAVCTPFNLLHNVSHILGTPAGLKDHSPIAEVVPQ